MQASRSPNVIQALMESINLSQPQPKIPPELIKFLAKNHSAWHIAIPLLENHVIIFPDETRCFHALSELYRLVSEQDIMYGLWKQRYAYSPPFLPSTRWPIAVNYFSKPEFKFIVCSCFDFDNAKKA